MLVTDSDKEVFKRFGPVSTVVTDQNFTPQFFYPGLVGNGPERTSGQRAFWRRLAEEISATLLLHGSINSTELFGHTTTLSTHHARIRLRYPTTNGTDSSVNQLGPELSKQGKQQYSILKYCHNTIHHPTQNSSVLEVQTTTSGTSPLRLSIRRLAFQ